MILSFISCWQLETFANGKYPRVAQKPGYDARSRLCESLLFLKIYRRLKLGPTNLYVWLFLCLYWHFSVHVSTNTETQSAGRKEKEAATSRTFPGRQLFWKATAVWKNSTSDKHICIPLRSMSGKCQCCSMYIKTTEYSEISNTVFKSKYFTYYWLLHPPVWLSPSSKAEFENLKPVYVGLMRRRLSKYENSSNCSLQIHLFFPQFEGQVQWILPSSPNPHKLYCGQTWRFL